MNKNNRIKTGKNLKQSKNILYTSQNLFNKMGLTTKKNITKNKKGNCINGNISNINLNYNNNPLAKSTSIVSVQFISKKNDLNEWF